MGRGFLRPPAKARAAVLVAFMTFLAMPVPAISAGADAVREALRYRLEFDGADSRIEAAGEPLLALGTLRRFYAERLYQPVWSHGRTEAVPALLEAVRASASHGLDPGDYHVGAIQRLLDAGAEGDESPDAAARVDLELLLTDAFLLLGAHLHSGRLNPVSIEPTWTAQRADVDLAAYLGAALTDARVGEALAALAPPQARYKRLQESLARYEGIRQSGGWTVIPPGPALEPGAESPRVPLLRARLQATGDLDGADVEDVDAPVVETSYDPRLKAAVEAFQRRHGLDVDGVVGRGTLAALNVPAATRVEQIRANLERWRWLPQSLGDPHIEVNIPGYSMAVIEGGREVFESQVIVGRNYRQTPVFSGRMTYLVLNPYWEVPPNLARQDIVPKVREDAAYLERMKFEILQGWGAQERRVDPSVVDWQAPPGSAFPYRLRQAPGPLNALGRVKFMFPNTHNVYIHDTPARELFGKSRRDFSSGCIRTTRPLELAAYLLQDNGGWSLERLNRVVDADRAPLTVPLKRPVDVHLLYWTAWADNAGAVQFREDIYGRDGAVLRALNAPPAVPQMEARK